jgi:uncharacterized protein (TIGR02301 family)
VRARSVIACLAAALALGLPLGASGQDRTPAERQTLIDLSYVLGESHALRQVCTGVGDQYWRGRMSELVMVEAPDAAFEHRMKDAFNAGYLARQAAFPTCTPRVRREVTATAARGAALATMLTSPAADDDAPPN